MKKLLILLSVLLLTPITFAANYYVDQDNGNNDNNGQSPNNAFRTVSKAYSVLSPGDTLHFMPDTYWEAIGTLSKLETQLNPITLKSYDNNNRALFKRTIDVDGSHIIIENIDFENANSWIDILEGNTIENSVWMNSNGQKTISNIDTSNLVYVLTYTCKWTGSEWRCGCRDSTCNQNYWQLQTFQS